jgi:hypothetical protein
MDITPSEELVFVITRVIQPLTEVRIEKRKRRTHWWQNLEKKKKAKNGEAPNFYFMMDDVLRNNNNQTCVPDYDELKRDILEESHHTLYTGHPSSTKMYQDMKKKY